MKVFFFSKFEGQKKRRLEKIEWSDDIHVFSIKFSLLAKELQGVQA